LQLEGGDGRLTNDLLTVAWEEERSRRKREEGSLAAGRQRRRKAFIVCVEAGYMECM